MSKPHSNTEGIEAPWVGDVINYWFEDLGESRWFKKSDATDAQIRDRFLGLHEWLIAQNGVGADEPRSTLATVIVLDQFSRNMFRGSPRAFAGDSIARQVSRVALERGFDLAMTHTERHFLYLPFEHSEDREDQALALRLISALGDDEWTRYAAAHKAIIDQFGRFPHRNVALGRSSTAEEIAALQGPMGSF
jgi:uncharacterized protein (DUF924 family)